jgi:nitric oxide reductase NorE protein
MSRDSRAAACAPPTSAHPPQDLEERGRHTPGEPELWILLTGDVCLFTVLFGVYLHARGVNPQLFAAAQRTLHVGLGTLNTLILLTSSVLLVYSVRALRRADTRAWAPPLALAATIVGACFVVVKAIEYRAMIGAGNTPATNDFYMYYFVLTGLHLLHVCVGLCVLMAVWASCRRSASSPKSLAFVEGGACFWHMVDLLWVVIFPLIFLVR